MQYLILSHILLMLFSFWPHSNGQYAGANENVSVIIENDSYLSIRGSTNVNNFNCSYEGQISNDTVQIGFSRNASGTLLLENASLTVEVTRFDCGNRVMNKDFKELLQYEKHPRINMNVLSLDMLPDTPRSGLIKVEFTIAGEAKIYRVPINFSTGSEGHVYQGEKKLDITDFDLTPPRKFLGMVVVDEEVIIDFQLNLRLL